MRPLKLAAIIASAAFVAMAFHYADFASVVSQHAHAHDVGLIVANALAGMSLDTLRTAHADLVAKATAKVAEMKDGLAAEAVAKIETDHAALLLQAKEHQAEIDRRAAVKDEPKAKAWASAFYMSAAAANIPLVELNAIVAKSDTADAAKDALIDAMAKAQNKNLPNNNSQHVSITADGRDKFMSGVTRSLIAKAAYLAGDKDGERNEFTSMSLSELARMTLEMGGVRKSFSDKFEMIGAAMAPVIMAGAMSTSDFVNILANVANKAMLKGYGEADETFQLWTAKGTLSDFKTVSRVDLGLFPALTKVEEGAEYTYAKLTDRAVTVALATYGKMFSITRQAIINDDLNAFTKIPGKMGRSAARTIGNLVYAILTSNPTMADSVALFHATHKNLQTGGGSVLGVTSLDIGRSAMAKQQDVDAVATALNIRPRSLIIPVALQGTATQLIRSQTEPGQSNPALANRVANMVQNVVADGRLDVASATAWYLAADASQTDTIEVSYLNGVDTPVLEQQNGWKVDGVEFKVRMDAGVNLLDFHGLYKSAGA